jgi:hypothetical protein
MRLKWIVVSVVALVQMTAAMAQGRADFSGEWVMDVDRTRAENRARTGATGGGGTMGVSTFGGAGAAGSAPAVTAVRITQTAGTMTIDRVSGQVWDKVVYKLDGAESANTNGRSTMKWKSRWEGAKLVSEGGSETTLPDNEGSISSTVKEVRSIDKEGVMVVETTRTVSATGIQIGSNGKPNTSVQYFTKRK